MKPNPYQTTRIAAPVPYTDNVVLTVTTQTISHLGELTGHTYAIPTTTDTKTTTMTATLKVTFKMFL